MYCDWPQLGRCCFCMPLRRGVLTFGYIHMFISVVMIAMYSSSMSTARMAEGLLFSRSMYLPVGVCISFFCFEVIFDGLLVFGAHKKSVRFLKAYYYYAIATSMALLVMQIVEIVMISKIFIYYVVEMVIIVTAGFCLQIYLITLVWSLIKKLEISGSNFENQLCQIVSGEQVENNRVYNNTTVVPTDV